jgi:hypothetical protein
VNPLIERLLPPVVGMIAFGAPTLWLAWQAWLARKSRNWPSTVGRVLGSRVQHDPNRLGRTHGTASVSYEYEVDGRKYRGYRVRFGGWLNANPTSAGRTVIRYREGSPVSVRYDPGKPRRCTLERRVSRQVWMFLGIGLFMTGSVFGALLGWWE